MENDIGQRKFSIKDMMKKQQLAAKLTVPFGPAVPEKDKAHMKKKTNMVRTTK